MRYLLILLSLLLLACSASDGTSSRSDDGGSEATVIYLSRHAEKAGGSDPGLLPAGTERARRLADRLSGESISAVYATRFRRTQATARPLAEAAGLSVRRYSASGSAEQLTRQWLKRHRGERIFVVGHSNTVPGLVNALLGEARYGDIEEEEFGRLFRVVVRADGAAEVTELRSD